MISRRKIRELIVQFLYQWEMNKGVGLDNMLLDFWDFSPLDQKDKEAVEQWLKEIAEHKEAIEEKINSYVKNWSLDRLAPVDKCILILGIYEILYRKDIPPAVSINESVEIAKKYSTEESGKFVNGILDSVLKDSGRKAWMSCP
ncbi:transcription antitermination factor NusB [Candidatus Methylacidiphilum infernorum]|uniref:Transcription antitermination protein NusB n=1 Tax=Methylacidiphilum infernorum (isolate V4) TaxID=481448 RepID=NUSB_METI4|nr:transcription antitermination factor NusB [Candidatus Methylacidiphilum infernorum]B3DWQ3.1 RecName: Full=Transcription antitermination protein NusB; AltName: Full=Antitermination factor NusB [Methylacidiphilum infernorum V4]ACD83716.1 Transcription termination protein NusB [Methylacidiphilum infernorum V4]